MRRGFRDAILNWRDANGTINSQGPDGTRAELEGIMMPLLMMGLPFPQNTNGSKSNLLSYIAMMSKLDQLELALRRLGLEPFILMNMIAALAKTRPFRIILFTKNRCEVFSQAFFNRLLPTNRVFIEQATISTDIERKFLALLREEDRWFAECM